MRDRLVWGEQALQNLEGSLTERGVDPGTADHITFGVWSFYYYGIHPRTRRRPPLVITTNVHQPEITLLLPMRVGQRNTSTHRGALRVQFEETVVKRAREDQPEISLAFLKRSEKPFKDQVSEWCSRHSSKSLGVIRGDIIADLRASQDPGIEVWLNTPIDHPMLPPSFKGKTPESLMGEPLMIKIMADQVRERNLEARFGSSS